MASQLILPKSSSGWLLRTPERQAVSRDQFQRVVQANPELRIELSADGHLIVMAPAHARTGFRNLEMSRQFANWALKDGRGAAFDSSTGFYLPNGANRSPDLSWVLKSRLEALGAVEREEFPPLCPDFVVELRSKTDRLSSLQRKMVEYMENGAILGWLIDPIKRRVHVYRPGTPPEILDDPATLSAEPELPGFVLDMTAIWTQKY